MKRTAIAIVITALGTLCNIAVAQAPDPLPAEAQKVLKLFVGKCDTTIDGDASLKGTATGVLVLGEPITLGELLATNREDPATAAARNLDWDGFLSCHDYRYGVVLKAMVEGRSGKETAARHGAGFSRIYQLHDKLAAELREFLGEEAVADAVQIRSWRGNLLADRERTACQADRRRGR